MEVAPRNSLTRKKLNDLLWTVITFTNAAAQHRTGVYSHDRLARGLRSMVARDIRARRISAASGLNMKAALAQVHHSITRYIVIRAGKSRILGI